MSAELNLALLGGSALLLLSLLAVRLAAATPLPSLLIYLGIGLAVGEAGAGVRFDNSRLTADLGLIALALILAEGGLTTRWSTVRRAFPFASVLSTLGVAVSVTVIALASKAVLGVDWRTAVILGAVVSSTDAAAVFTVLRRLPLRARLRASLEAESGLNDAPVVALVVIASSDEWGRTSGFEIFAIITFELLAAAGIGVGLGLLGAALLRRTALPAAGLYPLAALATALLGWAGANAVHASGFLAVYLTALVLGNQPIPHRRAVVGFSTSIALLAEAGLFFMLGLLASPARLPEAVPAALLVGAVASIVARPLAVVVSAVSFRLPWREQVFLSWAGLRGAVPIVVAVLPVNVGLPGATRIVDIAFVLVVVYTLIQAPTLGPLATRLGLTEAASTTELSVESAPLDEMHADILQFAVTDASGLHGLYVDELNLPGTARVSLIVREDRAVVPDPSTRLRSGDRVLLVTARSDADAVQRRLGDLSQHGRLAGWREQPGASGRRRGLRERRPPT